MNEDNILAGILGGVVADALGVPYEFKSREEMQDNPATTMTGFGTHNQPEGSWSDDSSLTLALLDSLTNGIDYDDIMYKFARWLYYNEYTPRNHVFDYGNATYKAISRYYDKGVNPLECGCKGERDNGNGSLMRIMPLLLYVNAKSLPLEEQMELVNNVSALTHAHDISKASCNIYNFVVQQVLNYGYEDFNKLILNGIEESRKYYDNGDYNCFKSLYDVLFELSESEIGSTGYVVGTLEIALYCCYHTSSYEEAVLKAVNLGGDTDTNAIVTGGLAAIYYGYGSIPEEWLNKIIKLDKIIELCETFYKSLIYF